MPEVALPLNPASAPLPGRDAGIRTAAVHYALQGWVLTEGGWGQAALFSLGGQQQEGAAAAGGLFKRLLAMPPVLHRLSWMLGDGDTQREAPSGQYR